MKVLTFLFGLLLVFSTQAQTTEAAFADNITTIIGLSTGAVETNPLGLLTLPAKFLVISAIASLPEEERAEPQAAVSSFWTGAAINNTCVILSLGVGTPVCMLSGIIGGLVFYSSTEDKRTFWKICRDMKKENPNLECKWNDSNKDS